MTQTWLSGELSSPVIEHSHKVWDSGPIAFLEVIKYVLGTEQAVDKISLLFKRLFYWVKTVTSNTHRMPAHLYTYFLLAGYVPPSPAQSMHTRTLCSLKLVCFKTSFEGLIFLNNFDMRQFKLKVKKCQA